MKQKSIKLTISVGKKRKSNDKLKRKMRKQMENNNKQKSYSAIDYRSIT
jgi:hypothetical protein